MNNACVHTCNKIEVNPNYIITQVRSYLHFTSRLIELFADPSLLVA